MHGLDKTTSGFRIWKAAIFELYFRFLFLPVCSYRDAILHPTAKFCSNQNWLYGRHLEKSIWRQKSADVCSNPTTGGGVMTSYRFLKMAAIKSEIYLRVQVS